MTADDTNPPGVPAHRHINPDGTLGGWVADTATVAATAHIGQYARVYGGTIWGGTIEGGTIWGGTILSSRHVLTVGPVGSEDQWLTLTRTDTGHRVTIGCWNGEHTIDDIPAEVQARCPEHADEYAELLPVLARRIAEWDTERATPAGSDRGTE